MVLKALKIHHLLLKGLLIILLVPPLNLFAQKLKLNEYDKAVKKWRMETFPVNLKTSDDTRMDISLAAADTSFVLLLTGSGVGTNTLDVNSEAVFLLDNDSAVIISSPAIQSIDYGEGLPTYRHQYRISAQHLEALSRRNLKSLRKYSVGGFDDIVIEKQNTTRLKELSALFMDELKKGKLFPEKPAILPAGFPGGNQVLVNFLNRNFKVRESLQGEEKRTAVVQFTVTTDGSINDLQVVRAAGGAFDNELLRILKRMPKWKPALQNGKPIVSVVNQPVIFSQFNSSLRVLLANN